MLYRRPDRVCSWHARDPRVSPISKLSRTHARKSRRPSGLNDAAATMSAGRSVTSRPSSSIRPLVTDQTEIQRSSVVLPAPLEPMRQAIRRLQQRDRAPQHLHISIAAAHASI